MLEAFCPICNRPGLVYRDNSGRYFVECFSEYCNFKNKNVRFKVELVAEKKTVLPNGGIFAKDAELNKSYLSSTSGGRKIVVIRKNWAGDVMSSVTVHEDGWNNPINISAGTELYPFREELYNPQNNQTQKVRSVSMSNENETKTKTPPRSGVIDAELAKAESAGQVPDYEAIATAVITAGLATEEDRSKVKNQAKARFKWYDSGKKVNPAKAQTASTKEAPPPPPPTQEG